MEIELIALCDAATDSMGKLNILGAFDSIVTQSVPVVHPQCAVALRIRFSQSEAGEHKVAVNLIDEDGKSIVPALDATVNIVFRGEEGASVATNMIMNLQRLQLANAGEYSIEVAVDGRHQRSIPLVVRLRPAGPTQL